MSLAPPDHLEPAVDRMTWLTEERIVAPAAGAPSRLRAHGAKRTLGSIQIHAGVGFVPAASGPGLVSWCDTRSTGYLATTGHTAGNVSPLASLGAGFG